MTTTYAYDAADRLVSFEESVEGDGAPPSHTLETYEWDAAGNRTAIERTDLGTGALERTELAYDDDDRLVEAAGPDGRTTYSYDAAGNLVEKSAPGENPVQYAYAAENRLAAPRHGALGPGIRARNVSRRVSAALSRSRASSAEPSRTWGSRRAPSPARSAASWREGRRGGAKPRRALPMPPIRGVARYGIGAAEKRK